MLSDHQINELERVISESKLQDIPVLLTRLVPTLFAELRLAREALRDQTDSFFQGVVNESGRSGDGSQGVPAGNVHGFGGPASPRANAPTDTVDAVSVRGGQAEDQVPAAPKRRRNRKRDGEVPVSVERGGSEPQVDRPISTGSTGEGEAPVPLDQGVIQDAPPYILGQGLLPICAIERNRGDE